MNVLITGGAGFVGSNLINGLLNIPKIKITVIDNLSYGNLKNLRNVYNKIKFIRKDITKINSSDFFISKIDVIIHLAAIAPLPDNQIDPYESMKNNVAGTANMLEISRLLKIKKFIFISSSAVYEGSSKRKIKSHENDKINTTLIYPTSKQMGEKLCDIYMKTYNLNIYVLRLFNLYGPNQDMYRKHPSLISQIIKSINKNQKLKVYNFDNKVKRDYVL